MNVSTGNSIRFECRPSYHGVAVTRSTGGSAASLGQGLFLPELDSRDRVLPQPALPGRLTKDELAELVHPDRPLALTYFGLKGQDKASNQDFALSAILRDRRGQAWKLAVVADGVSGKTFWPERASRIACLETYRFFRRAVEGEDILQSRAVEGVKRDLERLREGLAQALRGSLRADQNRLRKERHLCPSGYSAEIYRSRLRDDSLWYNTTLLISLTGLDWAILLWAGDGGVWIQKTGQNGAEEAQPLQSKPNLEINDFVSLNVQAGNFQPALIDLRPWNRVSILMASDGIDRTLQLQSKTYHMFLDEGSDPGRGRQGLQRSFGSLLRQPEVEKDNVSLVRTDWIRNQEVRRGRSLPRLQPLEIESQKPAPQTEKRPAPAVADPTPSRAAARSAPHETRRRALPPKTDDPSEREPLEEEPTPESFGWRRQRRRITGVVKLLSLLVLLASGSILGFLWGGREARSEASEPPTSNDLIQQVFAGLQANRQALDEIETLLEGRVLGPTIPTRGSEPANSSPKPDLEATLLLDQDLGQELAGESQEHLSLELVDALVRWVGVIEGAGEAHRELKVVAFADWNAKDPNPKVNIQHCKKNLELATRRASSYARLLTRFTQDRYTIRPLADICRLPPGVEGYQEAEARRLMLFPSEYQVRACDCTADLSVFETGS